MRQKRISRVSRSADAYMLCVYAFIVTGMRMLRILYFAKIWKNLIWIIEYFVHLQVIFLFNSFIFILVG